MRTSRSTVQRVTPGRIWSTVRPYRITLAAFVCIIILESVAALGPIWILAEIIDVAIPRGDKDLLTRYILTVFGFVLLSAFLGIAVRFFGSRLGELITRDLRVRLFRHIQRFPISFFAFARTGALTSRLGGDVLGVQQALTVTLGSLVRNVIAVFTTLTAMLLLDWRLALLALIPAPFFLLPYRRVGEAQRKMSREAMDLRADMAATTTERFGVPGAMLVKLFGTAETEAGEFSQKAGEVGAIGVKLAMFSQKITTVVILLSGAGSVVVYGVGGSFVIDGTFQIGELTAMGIFVSRLYGPLVELTGARVQLESALVSFDRVFEVLDAEPSLVEPSDPSILQHPRGVVEFRDVSFIYPSAREQPVPSLATSGLDASHTDESAVLRGISFRVEPGKKCAIVGPSGSGKTTITSLALRLHDPTKGQVLFDDTDLRCLHGESLRQSFGVVSQDSYFFHDSIGANLRYARPNASTDQLLGVCAQARILDLVKTLPEGLNTVIGEGGFRLSGGERQRLSIARMLLKDPAVVILDEATSQLDTESEQQVQLALGAALHGRTSIVIAHRLSTIVDADEILVVCEGQIVERGEHRGLLAEDGLYSALYERLASADRSIANSV